LAIGIYDAQTGQNPMAIDAFLKSTALNPGEVDAWFNLGSLYETGHNWPAATMAYKKLLGLQASSVFQRNFARQHLAGMENR
jgi:predicted TPR repeat methyltransferase